MYLYLVLCKWMVLGGMAVSMVHAFKRHIHICLPFLAHGPHPGHGRPFNVLTPMKASGMAVSMVSAFKQHCLPSLAHGSSTVLKASASSVQRMNGINVQTVNVDGAKVYYLDVDSTGEHMEQNLQVNPINPIPYSVF
jgi:hypothetical protein